MPKFTPDFESVYANTPVWPKAIYELVVDKVKGNAYQKDVDGKKVWVVSCNLTCKLKGTIDSAGKVKTELDGKNIVDQPVDTIKLYIHSQGAVKYTKGILMNIFGYTKKQEEEFNAWYKKQDFSIDPQEIEGEEGYDAVLGKGWELLVGKRFLASLSVGVYENPETKEKNDQQKFDSFYPADHKFGPKKEVAGKK